jgi:hypothetical protein
LEFSFIFCVSARNFVQHCILQVNNGDVIIENQFGECHHVIDQLSSIILHTWEKVTIIHYLRCGTKVNQVLSIKI